VDKSVDKLSTVAAVAAGLVMSSRANEKKACSAGRKTKIRPYDNRPGSGPASAKRRAGRNADAIRVDLPDEPLTLTPEAAWALLRILLKARDRRNGTDNPQGAAE
jgi:hypothetical protein